MNGDGSRRDGGRRVSAFRLKNEAQWHGDLAGFAVFVCSFKKQITIGDGEHFDHIRQTFCAQKRLLHQALAIGQTDKRLGVLLA